MFFIDTLRTKNLKKLESRREITFMPLAKVKNISFIFDFSEEGVLEAVKHLTTYALNHRIAYNGLSVNLNKSTFPQTVMNHNIRLLVKQELSVIGTPKGEMIEKYVSEPADLFIDMCPAYNYTFRYIALMVNAKFKVGRFAADHDPYDLIIAGSTPGQSPLDYVKQVIHYLTTIKSE
jgi:hypothetical protein